MGTWITAAWRVERIAESWRDSLGSPNGAREYDKASVHPVQRTMPLPSTRTAAIVQLSTMLLLTGGLSACAPTRGAPAPGVDWAVADVALLALTGEPLTGRRLPEGGCR